MYKDLLLPNKTYHIYNRGNNKEAIFKEAKNYPYFLTLWRKHINPIAYNLVYSLQPNHFHFMIRTKDADEDHDVQSKRINQSFSNFFNAYSKSINNLYERTGSLFQERFGRKNIESEDYFTTVIRYIHLNSEKHGIINNFRNYPFCSYNTILSYKPTSLLRNEILEWFGGREQYVEFHNNEQPVAINYLKNIDY